MAFEFYLDLKNTIQNKQLKNFEDSLFQQENERDFISGGIDSYSDFYAKIADLRSK